MDMLNALMVAATFAREKSYSPYSGFKVGASILLSNGQIISGCNVENASYGCTICAERNAIFKAISEYGPKIEIEEVFISTSDGSYPCGSCLQVLSEFSRPDTKIHLCDEKLNIVSNKLSNFLPIPFELKKT